MFGDVNRDGRDDLVGRLRSNGDVYVFLSTGSGFAFSPGTAPGGRWSYGWSSGYDLYLADANGDGRTDLVARYSGPTAGHTGDIEVAISSGSGFTYSGRWAYGYSAGYDMYFADVNGDGKADLVARYGGPNSSIAGNVYVMRSTGAGFSWNGQYEPWTYGWGTTYDLVVRDFTGDGRADLAGRHNGTGEVFVAISDATRFYFWGSWVENVVSSYELR
jgi:hypothetical protein